MKVLSFYNIKGGVGKTTFAVNTAFEAARSGLKTLIWDLDPQASASYILRIAPKFKGEIKRVAEKNPRLSKSIKETDWPLLDILPGDFELRTLSQSLQEHKRQANRLNLSIKYLQPHYDLIVIDSPPEASLVSENIINSSNLICAPVIPNYLSLNSLDQFMVFVDQAKKRSTNTCAAFNFVDQRKKLHKEIIKSYLGADPRFIDHFIPASSLVESMATRRNPVQCISPNSAVAEAFKEICEDLLTLIND